MVNRLQLCFLKDLASYPLSYVIYYLLLDIFYDDKSARRQIKKWFAHLCNNKWLEAGLDWYVIKSVSYFRFECIPTSWVRLSFHSCTTFSVLYCSPNTKFPRPEKTRKLLKSEIGMFLSPFGFPTRIWNPLSHDSLNYLP